jgi:hypothetical protein
MLDELPTDVHDGFGIFGPYLELTWKWFLGFGSQPCFWTWVFLSISSEILAGFFTSCTSQYVKKEHMF